jgi:hypothetical protein
VSSRIASIILSFVLLIVPITSSAQTLQTNVIADLKAGEPAPFDGVLMSHDVVAEIVVEMEHAHESCAIDLEEQRRMTAIEHEHKLAQCELLKNIETDRLNKLVEVKQQRVDFLEKRWTPVPWYESPVFWYAAGMASGIILTAGTAYLLMSANN